MRKRPSLAVAPAHKSLSAGPDLSRAHKRAIEGALRWAWKKIAASNPNVLRVGAEEDITRDLPGAG